MIRITADHIRKLIHIEVSGLLTAPEVSDFCKLQQDTLGAMAAQGGQISVLVDASKCCIQPQDVVDAFRNFLNHNRLRARRIAVVRGNALTGAQLRRIVADRDEALVVDSVEQAEAFLFNTPAPRSSDYVVQSMRAAI